METPLRRNAAWLVVAIAYVSAFPYFEKLNNPNENVRVWAARAVVQHGELNLGKVMAEWGYVNDKAISGKMLFSGKAPGTTFLGVPVLYAQTKLWKLLGWNPPSKLGATLALRVGSVALPLLIFLWFFARHIERIVKSPAVRDLLVLGLGVGTLMYPYGITFVGHAQAAAAAYTGFMLLPARGEPPPSRARLQWAGVCVALSVVFEYQAALVAVLLGAYAAAVLRRRWGWFLLGASLPALLLGAYHTALFGRPWDFPYAHLENTGFAQLWYQKDNWFIGLGKVHSSAVAVTTFAPSYGLFAFSPFLLLGVAGAIAAIIKGPRLQGALMLAIAAAMFAFLWRMSNWRGGWCVGPRYIAAAVPFLAWGAGLLYARCRGRPRARSAVAVALGGLVAVSIFMNALSATVYPHYPEQFDNPLFDLTIPLLASGYAPYSLGTLLGLHGAVSLAPLGLVLVLGLALGMGGDDDRPRRWVSQTSGAVLLASTIILALAKYGRAPSRAEDGARGFVESYWEPRRRVDTPPSFAPPAPAVPGAAPPPGSKPR